MPKHYAPGGGASGSSVRNQNNELIGVYHVSNNVAKTGLAAAFRSEGYDYGDLFDNQYKLPQYDLIYGGGADQRNSYRQALKQLYGENYQTALFNNGVGDNQIPEEFNAQAGVQWLFTGAIPLLISTGVLTCSVSDLGRFTPP